MKLLLASESTNVRDQILKILPNPPSETKVIKVMTAAKGEDDMSYVFWETEQLRKIGLQVEDLDIEGKNESQLREILEKADVIYVGGGNTFYLLKYVKESGFDKVVIDLIKKGTIYVGVSAGTILATPTIEVAGWKNIDKNDVGITDLSALHLIDFHIFVHYSPEYKEMIKEELSKKPLSIRMLTNDQAFLIEDNTVQLLGKGEEIII